jgi:hypothetical protein
MAGGAEKRKQRWRSARRNQSVAFNAGLLAFVLISICQ